MSLRTGSRLRSTLMVTAETQGLQAVSLPSIFFSSLSGLSDGLPSALPLLVLLLSECKIRVQNQRDFALSEHPFGASPSLRRGSSLLSSPYHKFGHTYCMADVSQCICTPRRLLQPRDATPQSFAPSHTIHPCRHCDPEKSTLSRSGRPLSRPPPRPRGAGSPMVSMAGCRKALVLARGNRRMLALRGVIVFLGIFV